MLPRALRKMRERGGRWRDLWQRLGFFGTEQRENITSLRNRGPVVWMHAVSVGEVGIARKLMAEIFRTRSDVSFVLSTTTPTGHALADEFARMNEDRICIIYNPLDGWFSVRRCLRLISPAKIVLVEAEVWPNLVSAAAGRGIPVELVNARLSPRSERRYRRFRALASPVFSMLSRVQVQEPEDVARWVGIGVPENKVVRTGSIKFDPAGQVVSDEKIRELQRVLQSCIGDAPRRIILAASTHNGEEAAIAEIYQRLRQRMADLFFIVVPRHVERADGITAGLEGIGLKIQRRSTQSSASCDVLIVDTTGELAAWQHLADLVVIGKSFLATGGQNPAEAIVAGKPVVFGPHMENFDALVKMLLARDGAVQVADLPELETRAAALLGDAPGSQRIAAAGRAALEAHRGATRMAAELVTAGL